MYCDGIIPVLNAGIIFIAVHDPIISQGIAIKSVLLAAFLFGRTIRFVVVRHAFSDTYLHCVKCHIQIP